MAGPRQWRWNLQRQSNALSERSESKGRSGAFCKAGGTQMPFYAYILRCGDDSYYVGHCKNLEHRVHEHELGEGAKYTREHLPVALVYHERFETEAEAVRRERQLKRWSRAKKQALIAGDMIRLRHAAARRQ